ncbi:MAG: hypothetical protein A2928_00225 [Candidatus Taylorbacteria bacterium RIFCSPLOWO2_01_FULL_45_15b]|uniref:Type 4 fimbrial biogenesis protein PilO n=1 Tax=Candidatus Taylorbacteria bacterium RIFCSPLOWO2_01_FULL_45_15b TaxID=1802319 RepID=A0A1G2N7A8_9BACT|nr:MAG: hypothetical protein A2928_00225 [Candidatus Taylorbacteria bacterium RIFCSPLOWO2_01_FULL_45_15b]
MKINRRTSLTLLSLLILFVASFAGWYVLYRATLQNRAAIHITEELLGKNNDEVSYYALLKRTFEATEIEREKIETYFVSDGTVVPFIESIEALRTISGISTKISTLAVETPESGDVEYLHVVIDVDGSWDGVYRFVSLVEKLPHAIRIEKVAFDKTLGENSVWRSNISLRVAKNKLGTQ